MIEILASKVIKREKESAERNVINPKSLTHSSIQLIINFIILTTNCKLKSFC